VQRRHNNMMIFTQHICHAYRNFVLFVQMNLTYSSLFSLRLRRKLSQMTRAIVITKREMRCKQHFIGCFRGFDLIFATLDYSSFPLGDLIRLITYLIHGGCTFYRPKYNLTHAKAGQLPELEGFCVTCCSAKSSDIQTYYARTRLYCSRSHTLLEMGVRRQLRMRTNRVVFELGFVRMRTAA